MSDANLIAFYLLLEARILIGYPFYLIVLNVILKISSTLDN
jgi:hypothetical protein